MHNLQGIKPLKRLRDGLSHMHEYKFRHIFQDCGQCLFFSNHRKILFDKISIIKRSLLTQNDPTIVKIFLFGSNDLNDERNALMAKSSIEYIRTMER